MHTAFVLALGLSPSVAHAAPAMVTTTRGDVQIAREGTREAAPVPPFLLGEDDRLVLAEGALVVVLFEGTASQILGPGEVTRADLKVREVEATAGARALDALLSRRVDTSTAGASRSGAEGLRLVRPVPGSRVVSLPYVDIRCDACAETSVVLYDLRNDLDLWTGSGAGRIPYDGPDLDPGPYLLGLGDRDHAITIATPQEREELERLVAAARAATDRLVGAEADEAARVSVVASVYLHAGYPSEALYTIDDALADHPDDPDLAALRDAFELRAGIVP